MVRGGDGEVRSGSFEVAMEVEGGPDIISDEGCSVTEGEVT